METERLFSCRLMSQFTNTQKISLLKFESYLHLPVCILQFKRAVLRRCESVPIALDRRVSYSLRPLETSVEYCLV